MSNGVADSQSCGQIVDSPRGLDTSSTKEPTGNSFGIPHSNRTMARTTISVAVDPVALITTECITVTSAMRKNPRWAHSSVSAILGGSSTPTNPSSQSSRPSTPGDELGTRKGLKNRHGVADGEDGGLANRWGLRGKKGKSMQDNPLMAGFGRLRHELTGCKGMGDSLSLVVANY
jgi:brefeldin A-resistance guanine nucleotide exchange factor 1